MVLRVVNWRLESMTTWSGHLQDFEVGMLERMDADVLASTRHGTPIKVMD